jgi:thioredoxin 1
MFARVGTSPGMEHSSLVEVHDGNFGEVVEASPLPVLLEFTAVWCAPCRTIAPAVEAIAGQYAGRVVVGKADLDGNAALAERFGVRSIPTLLMLERGEVVGQIVGAVPRARIERLVEGALTGGRRAPSGAGRPSVSGPS